jgi:hypothetical protein
MAARRGIVRIHWMAQKRLNPGSPVGQEEYGHAGPYGDFQQSAPDWQRVPVAGETVYFSDEKDTENGFTVERVEWHSLGYPIVYLETYREYDEHDDFTGEQYLRSVGFMSAAEYESGPQFI